MGRYKTVRELGRNQQGGRITYLATDTSVNPPQQVVIKEFRFAASGANWSGFKAYEREIEILRQLEYPRIPRYLDSLETETGFCLVQEYKDAPSLAERRSFNPEDIKQIAVSVLEILVYLQKRTPPVIHRDIKPENILVDKQLNAYLIDFGFARIRGGELALSSVAAGTPGFMPPEEQFGRPLTEASDLYSLGATLICLLTGTRSVDVGNLIDDNYRFDFKKLVPQLSPAFISWLQKIVAPNVKQRYANAAAAWETLQSIRVVGGVTWQDCLVGAIKPKKPVIKRKTPVAALGLSTLVITGAGATLMSFPKDSLVTQLLETKQCQECHLKYANLEGANLEGANLEGVNLEYADLEYANLGGAYLRSANLGRTNLERAYLRSANLGRADLGGANLESANLGRAYLEYAYLRSTNLEGTNLKDAQLADADLKGANLRGAQLGNADLKGANLRGAQLADADLKGAKLERANLKSANLKDADLRDVFLEDANLRGANLEGANLEGANLKGVIMPDGKKYE